DAPATSRAPALWPLLRPSRGIHLVYPALTRGCGLLMRARGDGRVFFVVPLGRHSLVGTTEVEVPSPPPAGSERASADEIRYLHGELRRPLPRCAETRPVAVFGGLRPLLRSQGSVGRANREHRIVEEHGLFTIAGGKYPPFRVMARDLLRRIAPSL